MSKPDSQTLNRRTAFLGAGAVGALAAAVAVLPKGAKPVPQTAEVVKTDDSGGYQLTEHVKRYYATARI
jgi:hypothetical protein